MQCVRYVVRNNFFGLESKPQSQEGTKTVPSITTVQHEGRQEKPSQSVRLLGAECAATSHEGDQEDLVQSKDVLATGVESDRCLPQNCQDQRLRNGHVCSEASKDTEQVAGDFSQDGEETTSRDCHSPVLTTPEKITSTSNVYDDEIWES